MIKFYLTEHCATVNVYEYEGESEEEVDRMFYRGDPGKLIASSEEYKEHEIEVKND
jgi:hypothetical protein